MEVLYSNYQLLYSICYLLIYHLFSGEHSPSLISPSAEKQRQLSLLLPTEKTVMQNDFGPAFPLSTHDNKLPIFFSPYS